MTALNKHGKTIGTGLPGPGRPSGSPNKATSALRDAVAQLAEANATKLQEWLDRVARDNPKAALDAYIKIAEFVLPRVSRASPQVPENYPREIVVSWVAVDK